LSTQNRSLLKFSDSYSFDIDESDYDNLTALSSSNVNSRVSIHKPHS